MKSYAKVKVAHDNLIIFQVEMTDRENGNYGKKMKLLGVEDKWELTIWLSSGKLNEGDIFVVEHDGENISKILYKDEAEKKRRQKLA